MRYVIYSEYLDVYEAVDSYDEAIQAATDFMHRQRDDDGMNSGCEVEVYKLVATVTGSISVKIEIKEEPEEIGDEPCTIGDSDA